MAATSSVAIDAMRQTRAPRRGIGEVPHRRQSQLADLSGMERDMEGRRTWIFSGTKARFEMAS